MYRLAFFFILFRCRARNQFAALFFFLPPPFSSQLEDPHLFRLVFFVSFSDRFFFLLYLKTLEGLEKGLHVRGGRREKKKNKINGDSRTYKNYCKKKRFLFLEFLLLFFAYILVLTLTAEPQWAGWLSVKVEKSPLFFFKYFCIGSHSFLP